MFNNQLSVGRKALIYSWRKPFHHGLFQATDIVSLNAELGIIGIISLHKLVWTGSSTPLVLMDGCRRIKQTAWFCCCCICIYPLLTVFFSFKCMITLPFDVKVLQRSSDISGNSNTDFTLIIYFYLRYLNLLSLWESVNDSYFPLFYVEKIMATHIWQPPKMTSLLWIPIPLNPPYWLGVLSYS